MWLQKTHRPPTGSLRSKSRQKSSTMAFTVVLMLTVVLLPPAQADPADLGAVGQDPEEYDLLPAAGGHDWEMLSFDCSGSYTTDTTADVTGHAEHKKTWTGTRVEVDTSTTTETDINYFFSCNAVWEAEGFGTGGHSRRVTLQIPTGSTETTADRDLAGEYGQESVAYSESSSGCTYWGYPLGQPGCGQRFLETFYDERYVEGTRAMPMDACLDVETTTITVVNRHWDSFGQDAARVGLSLPITPYPYESTAIIRGVSGTFCTGIDWTEIGGSDHELDLVLEGLEQRF